ncbi:Mitochondrial amidoxime reducing component 2, partial [Pseudolycoriella hygida]
MPNNLKCFLVMFGISVAFAIYFFKKLSKGMPKNWKKIGKISEIYCFPVMSCAPVRITKSILCSEIGLQDGELREKAFLIVNSDYVIQRNQKLWLVQPNIVNDKLILMAPKMKDFSLNISELYNSNATVTHFAHPAGAVDCGNDVATWLSFYMSENALNEGYRLVFYPDTSSTREHRTKSINLKYVGCNQSVSDYDGYSMINAESVKELNRYLIKPLTAAHTRPNFLVDGAKASDEDSWDWMRIGENLIFKTIKVTKVLILQTTETAQDNENVPSSHSLGVNLVTLSSAYVNCGDDVYMISVDNLSEVMIIPSRFEVIIIDPDVWAPDAYEDYSDSTASETCAQIANINATLPDEDLTEQPINSSTEQSPSTDDSNKLLHPDDEVKNLDMWLDSIQPMDAPDFSVEAMNLFEETQAIYYQCYDDNKSYMGDEIATEEYSSKQALSKEASSEEMSTKETLRKEAPSEEVGNVCEPVLNASVEQKKYETPIQMEKSPERPRKRKLKLEEYYKRNPSLQFNKSKSVKVDEVAAEEKAPKAVEKVVAFDMESNTDMKIPCNIEKRSSSRVRNTQDINDKITGKQFRQHDANVENPIHKCLSEKDPPGLQTYNSPTGNVPSPTPSTSNGLSGRNLPSSRPVINQKRSSSRVRNTQDIHDKITGKQFRHDANVENPIHKCLSEKDPPGLHTYNSPTGNVPSPTPSTSNGLSGSNLPSSRPVINQKRSSSCVRNSQDIYDKITGNQFRQHDANVENSIFKTNSSWEWKKDPLRLLTYDSPTGNVPFSRPSTSNGFSGSNLPSSRLTARNESSRFSRPGMFRNPPDDRSTSENKKGERHVIYVGKLHRTTSREDLLAKFSKYGRIRNVSTHYNNQGEKYGFVRFKSAADACEVCRYHTHDANIKMYDICFGERRKFCGTNYFDLDNADANERANCRSAQPPKQSFEELLESAKRAQKAKKLS